MAVFNAGIIVHGLYSGDASAIDMGKFLVPFSVAAVTAAMGADFVHKQGAK